MTRQYPPRPIVGIGAVVWRGDEVLLIRRGKPPREGRWSLPGGAQRVGETIAEAAVREVREEAGIEIEVGGLVDAVDSIDRDSEGRVQYHYTLIDVTAEWQSGEIRAGSDATDAGWFSLGALGKMDLWSETLRVVRQAARQRAGKARTEP